MQKKWTSWAGPIFNQRGTTRIFEFKTSAQYICAAHPTEAQKIDFVVGNIDLDSHTDTTVAGKNCTVLAYTYRKFNVASYFDEYEPFMSVSIVHAATGYTTAYGRNFIIVFNEALNILNLPHSLVNQNQSRHFGTVIQDITYSSVLITLLYRP